VRKPNRPTQTQNQTRPEEEEEEEGETNQNNNNDPKIEKSRNPSTKSQKKHTQT
jgi:hypothetical protein